MKRKRKRERSVHCCGNGDGYSQLISRIPNTLSALFHRSFLTENRETVWRGEDIHQVELDESFGESLIQLESTIRR